VTCVRVVMSVFHPAMCRQKTGKKRYASISCGSLEVYANFMSCNNVQINLVEFMTLCFQLTTALIVMSCQNKHGVFYVLLTMHPCIIL
jgi:hypothetical protein